MASTAPSPSSIDLYRGLIRVSCIINSIHDYRELLTSLLQTTKEVMNCDAGSIMLYESETNDLAWHIALGEKADKLKEVGRLKMGQGVAGWVAQNQKSTLVADAATDSRFFKGADTKTGFRTRSIVCVPLLVGKKLVGVLQALNPLHKNFFDETDLEVFEAYGALAATAIEKIRWQEGMLQQKKHEQELEIAKEIQERFLTSHFANAEAVFQLAFHYQAAAKVGGDFYDVQPVHNDRYAILLGDVSGKGVPAALLMAQILSEFRHFAHDETNPGIILSHLNSYLTVQSTRGMFATAWCAVVQPFPHHLEIHQASAGHLPPLYRSSSGVDALELPSGPPIGVIPGIDYSATALRMNAGESLFLYTDGVTEGRNPEGEEFGLDRLQNLMASLPPDLPAAMSKIIQTMERFICGSVQRDDITFLLFAPK